MTNEVSPSSPSFISRRWFYLHWSLRSQVMESLPNAEGSADWSGTPLIEVCIMTSPQCSWAQRGSRVLDKPRNHFVWACKLVHITSLL